MLDVKNIRNDFPMLKNKSKKGYDIIYMDNAATTFKPQSVIDAVNEYYTKIPLEIETLFAEMGFKKIDLSVELARNKIIFL